MALFNKFKICILERLSTKIAKIIFVAREKILLRLCVRRKIKILFSHEPGWEISIRNGFKYSQHELTFNELSHSEINNYDLVVPLNIRDLQYLNEVRHLIEHNPIPIPSSTSIALCDDKLLLNRTLINNGFEKFIPIMGNMQRYPFILKKRKDEWGRNSNIIFDSEQEHISADTINNPDYFYQELILGPEEYATHILFVNQKIQCSMNIRYTFKIDTPIKGKDSSIKTEICNCPCLDLFSSILMSIDYEGLCCINYKTVNGHPFILEVNPRFGGSLAPFFFSFIRYLDLKNVEYR
jgi:hypothetical protein